MISGRHILAGLTAAVVTVAVAATPTTSSVARDDGGHKRPDIGARHGHRHVIR
jgi:hypothetical protein